jgi:hypothetical protein
MLTHVNPGTPAPFQPCRWLPCDEPYRSWLLLRPLPTCSSTSGPCRPLPTPGEQLDTEVRCVELVEQVCEAGLGVNDSGRRHMVPSSSWVVLILWA